MKLSFVEVTRSYDALSKTEGSERAHRAVSSIADPSDMLPVLMQLDNSLSQLLAMHEKSHQVLKEDRRVEDSRRKYKEECEVRGRSLAARISLQQSKPTWIPCWNSIRTT